MITYQAHKLQDDSFRRWRSSPLQPRQRQEIDPSCDRQLWQIQEWYAGVTIVLVSCTVVGISPLFRWIHHNWTHLCSVSAGFSKLFCALSSVIRSSFVATSSGLGKAVDIGGVTPHCLTGCVDMSAGRKGSPQWKCASKGKRKKKNFPRKGRPPTKIRKNTKSRPDGKQWGKKGSDISEARVERKKES